ncbi:amidohydrolase family protein [Escherichia coli]|nr:amidohydrolase family protein [Escherichia coli]
MASRGGIEESLEPSLFDEKHIKQLFDKYSECLLGLKIRFSKHLVGDAGAEPLYRTLELARRLNVAVCVHTTDPPLDAGELVSLLDKNDIYCHVYQGVGSTIIDQHGVLKPEFIEARKRGVIFDAANGRMNFDYGVANAAIRNNFWPDIISTDLTSLSCNVPGISPVKNLSFLMSKYLNLGMDMNSIIRSVTETPARLMALEGVIGTLAPGSKADICIMKILNSEKTYIDSNGVGFVGKRLFSTYATVADGNVVYISNDI